MSAAPAHAAGVADPVALSLLPLLSAVPILASLSRDEKLTLLDAFEEKSFRPGDTVVRQVRG